MRPTGRIDRLGRCLRVSTLDRASSVGVFVVTIRSARIDDAEAIRAIYNVEVITSTTVFDLEPRSLDDQQRWLVDRSGAHAVLVAVRPTRSSDSGR